MTVSENVVNIGIDWGFGCIKIAFRTPVGNYYKVIRNTVLLSKYFCSFGSSAASTESLTIKIDHVGFASLPISDRILSPLWNCDHSEFVLFAYSLKKVVTSILQGNSFSGPISVNFCCSDLSSTTKDRETELISVLRVAGFEKANILPWSSTVLNSFQISEFFCEGPILILDIGSQQTQWATADFSKSPYQDQDCGSFQFISVNEFQTMVNDVINMHLSKLKYILDLDSISRAVFQCLQDEDIYEREDFDDELVFDIIQDVIIQVSEWWKLVLDTLGKFDHCKVFVIGGGVTYPILLIELGKLFGQEIVGDQLHRSHTVASGALIHNCSVVDNSVCMLTDKEKLAMTIIKRLAIREAHYKKSYNRLMKLKEKVLQYKQIISLEDYSNVPKLFHLFPSQSIVDFLSSVERYINSNLYEICDKYLVHHIEKFLTQLFEID
ncbi:hypothetical protein RCL1_001321 [Eukaryota sp. TZLM3-RCL]